MLRTNRVVLVCCILSMETQHRGDQEMARRAEKVSASLVLLSNTIVIDEDDDWCDDSARLPAPPSPRDLSASFPVAVHRSQLSPGVNLAARNLRSSSSSSSSFSSSSRSLPPEDTASVPV